MSKTMEAILNAEHEHETNNGVHIQYDSFWCKFCPKGDKTMRETCMEVYPEKFKNMNFTIDVPEKVCEYGHICTSECQNTKDCPCVNDHFCSMGEHEISEYLASDDGVCNNHKDSVPDESYNDEDYETRRDNDGTVNFIS